MLIYQMLRNILCFSFVLSFSISNEISLLKKKLINFCLKQNYLNENHLFATQFVDVHDVVFDEISREFRELSIAW